MPITVVKTIRASGGDYTTLSAWEAANQGDLVAADEVRVAECYNDWPSGLVDSVTIDGSTTDATRYLKITVAVGHRHTGIPQTGFFMEKSINWVGVIGLSDPSCVLEWLDVENTSATGSYGFHFAAEDCLIVDCIAKATVAAYNFPLGASVRGVIGCLAYGTASAHGFWLENWTIVPFYNCVATNCSIGFYTSTGGTTRVFKNCVAYNNTTNWSIGAYDTVNSTNNATSSETDDAPGDSSVFGVVAADFVDAANNDFHLSAGSILRGAGVNLSADFTTDIDGDTWPSIGPWDIGFDYYVASGPSVPTLSSAMATSITATSAVPQVTLTF